MSMLYLPEPVELSGRLGLPLSVTCFLIYFVVFHLVCAFFGISDHLKLFRKYKLHDSDEKTYLQLLPRVLFNQLVFFLPSCVFAERLGWVFRTPTQENTFSLWKLPIYLSLFSVYEEIIFYSAHRWLLHSKWGFTLLGHNVHHSTKGSVGISQHYMSVIDYFLEIVVAILVPLAIIRANAYFDLLIIVENAILGPYDHSGYDFFLGSLRRYSPVNHSMHHLRSSCSYGDSVGSMAILDSLFKTSFFHFGYQSFPKIKNDNKNKEEPKATGS
ncbi:hypothetical protein GpartN1_g5950.t1 [Galdieria partita]|uniref:Fatty acid hydroxylase domain-containing protein n=1 Tax=Galdieria partita TaxID=83374 RepID=A0A9C7PX16_9RHOD|nr:hypothetical protein GpartN1_g3962.t1 [Galdieria partita]GJQ14159.1 hypothetical protein GpartN1_g5950.t1 [Galdieria partita]